MHLGGQTAGHIQGEKMRNDALIRGGKKIIAEINARDEVERIEHGERSRYATHSDCR